ncbi:MAG: hypothetical protein ABWY51_05195 [Gaiellaceae bacterium]
MAKGVQALVGRVSGMVTIARALPGQKRVPFRDREQLLEDRDRRVRETVSYAVEHVPYYRELFVRGEIDPREIRTADDLTSLPLVGRDEVLPEARQFRSVAPGTRDGIELQSSGTTGVPLRLFHDRRSVLRNVAYAERERAVESALVGKRLRYTRMYLGSGFTENVDRVRGLMARASFRPFRPTFRRASLGGKPEGVYRTIDSIKPDVIMGCGSHLESFFRAAVERGGPTHRPKALLYTWDQMTARGRRLIEEHFGIPVISRYSAMESLKIGYVCERRGGFHLHEDLCHVTIADPDGVEVPDGQPGEIVLSNLVNRGTVLLRYRIGDLGRISTETCTCGRSSRVLADLEGRATEYIPLLDGDNVGPLRVTMAVGQVPGIVRYQLVQRTPSAFELRLETADRNVFDLGAAAAVAAVRKILPGYEVEVTYAETVVPEPRRKYRPIVLLDTAP